MEAEEHKQFMEWKYGSVAYRINFPGARWPEKHEWVRVHMNLNKRCFSLSRYYKPRHTWYVVRHPQRIFLRDCIFKVSEAGRMRTIRDGVRNVHAYVYGYFEDVDYMVYGAEGVIGFELVKYNPFRRDSFYMPAQWAEQKDVPINRARWFVGTEKHCMVFPHLEGELYETV